MPERAPNLLFLITDQQQAATLEPHAPFPLPNLNALAQGGVRFANCYAPNPICAPARASLFTGLLPHNHGMVDNPHTVEAYRANLKDGLPFWSRALQRSGYTTAYYGKWHIERSLRLENFGFSDYETEEDAYQGYRRYRLEMGLPEKPAAPVNTVQVAHKGYKPFVLSGVRPEPPEATLEYHLYSRGIDFIQRQAQRENDQPWALVLSTLAPHDPYIVPQEYATRCEPGAVPTPPSFHDPLSNRPVIYRRLQEVWRSLEWEHFARAIASYYAFCALIDDQVGRLMSALRAAGQMENTLVVFVSDHGDYLGAHRLMLKGIPAFEQAYRVPLILNGPGLPAGLVINQRVSQLDLAASMLPLLTGEPYDCQDHPCFGRSLLPLISAEWQGQPLHWDSQHFAECHGQRFFYTQRVLWWQNYKYVFNGFDQDEFYHLSDDPYEMENRAGEPRFRPVIEEMSARMWQVMRATGDYNMTEAEYAMFRFAPVGPQSAHHAKEGA